MPAELSFPVGILEKSMTTMMAVSTMPRPMYVSEMLLREMLLRMNCWLSRMPVMLPMGLKDCAMFSRRVAVWGEPIERM